MKNSTISIIVPVYNTEKYLPSCLDSILSQTISDWECVLVDDGSKDNSGQICDEYAARDSRFVVIHKPNEGVAKARITAYEHSHGELITFIDSDDTVSPLYLEKLSRPILEEKADMVSCDYYKLENDRREEPLAKLTGTYEKQEVKDFIASHYFYERKLNGYGMTPFLCTKMVRRELVADGLKEGEGMWFGEDQIAMFKMLINCRNLVLLPDRLYNYIFHEGQAVKRYNKSLWEEVIRLLDKYKELGKKMSIKDGLKNRTWVYIRRIIYEKMAQEDMDYATYKQHISYMRNTPYMKDFFRSWTVDFDKKNRKRYWLLKLKLYRFSYNTMVKKRALKAKV